MWPAAHSAKFSCRLHVRLACYSIWCCAGSYPQIVITGSPADDLTQELLAAAHAVYVPFKVSSPAPREPVTSGWYGHVVLHMLQAASVQAVIPVDPADERCTAFWERRNPAVAELVSAARGKVSAAPGAEVYIQQHLLWLAGADVHLCLPAGPQSVCVSGLLVPGPHF